MTGRTDSLTQMPDREDRVPRLSGNDVLSDALSVFRVTGAALLRGHFSRSVAVDAPPARLLADIFHPGAARVMVLHIVAQGACWVEAEGIPRTPLPEGSICCFPLGHAHRIGKDEGGDPVRIESLLPPLPWRELPVLGDGREAPATHLVCTYLRCDDLLANPILDSLPELLAVSPSSDKDARRIATNVEYIVREATQDRPGAAGLIARLTELLFIEVLRHHLETRQTGTTGWLAALADPSLARALSAFHGDPAYQWTLEETARLAGLSRTVLIERFQRVLSVPPMRYLTLWRLQLAAAALRHTRKTIACIAAEVGYGSEEAFSRAFKRESGHTPADWRQSIQ